MGSSGSRECVWVHVSIETGKEGVATVASMNPHIFSPVPCSFSRFFPFSPFAPFSPFSPFLMMLSCPFCSFSFPPRAFPHLVAHAVLCCPLPALAFCLRWVFACVYALLFSARVYVYSCWLVCVQFVLLLLHHHRQVPSQGCPYILQV